MSSQFLMDPITFLPSQSVNLRGLTGLNTEWRRIGVGLVPFPTLSPPLSSLPLSFQNCRLLLTRIKVLLCLFQDPGMYSMTDL